MALLARDDRRLRRDRGGRHARRAPRPPSRPARSGRDARVVLLVTGDGLKTPQAVSHTYAPMRIEADADVFVEDVLVV